MKRLLAIVISTLLLTGCGTATSSSTSASKEIESIPTAISSSAPESKATEASSVKEQPKAEEQVLFDQDGILIVFKGIIEGDYLGPELKIAIENNSDAPITVQTRDFSVNGYMINGVIFSPNIQPGKKANDKITIMGSSLEENDITDIEDVEFKLHIFNSDSWDGITDTEPIIITFK